MYALQGTPAFPSAEVTRACVHMLSEMSSLGALVARVSFSSDLRPMCCEQSIPHIYPDI